MVAPFALPELYPLRITFVAPFGLGEKTTVWARTLPLARWLAANGCAVTVVIPPWDTPRDAGHRWIDSGVHIVNTSLTGGPPFILSRLLWAVHRSRPHLVHVVKPRAYAGLVHWTLRQGWRLWPGRPLILLDMDDWEQAWTELNRHPWPLAQFLDWQEQWGIAHADGITAASRWLVDKAQELAEDTPVRYLPNGVDRPRTNGRIQPPATDEPTVLLFSRFVEVGPGWMSTFWRVLRALRPGVRLRVGGKALQPGREAAFREALDVDHSNVEWLGFVPPQELPALYDQTSCAIFPANNMPLNQAKCSVRLATTLLRGVPVVASAVGEQAQYGAGGAARLVHPDATPAQFARAVAELLADPTARDGISQQARARLLVRYDWDRLASSLLDFYKKLLVRRARRMGLG